MKKELQVVLAVIILGICSYLIVCNIEHIRNLQKRTYAYDFQNGGEIKNIEKSLANIKSNILKIEKLNNSYLPEDKINKIKGNLLKKVEFIESLEFWTYTKEQNFMSEPEFFNMINKNFQVGILDLIEDYRLISEYNEKLDLEGFIEYGLTLMISADSIISPLMDNYQYRSKNIDNINNNFKVNLLMNDLSVRVNTIEYISNLVVESGDINE